ncbi:MAG TPA: DUF6184 family natural product biosynthesis lipoprotein [Polyangiaceae bacterium]
MKTSRLTALAGLLCLVAAGSGGCERRGEERRGETTREADRVPSEVTPREGMPGDQPTPNEPSGTLEPGRSDPGAAGLPRQGNAAAITAITEARCDREMRCNNIASGKKFETRAACIEKTRNDWREDLNGIDCPRGVMDKELADCVSQIRSESCANPFDRLGSSMACSSTDLCKTSS